MGGKEGRKQGIEMDLREIMCRQGKKDQMEC